jgi:hypothetical protein
MGVPALVQHASGPSSINNGTATSNYIIVLPNKTLAGNCVVVGFQYANNRTVTSVVDDLSQTYSAVVTGNDTTNGQKNSIYVFPNTAAGARAITITLSGASQWKSAVASEFYNVATASPVDKSSANPSSGPQQVSATITAGSVTPGVTGDLLWMFAICDSSPAATSYTAGSQSNITWRLLSASLQDGTACQYGVYNSTSAINATMTQAPSQAFVATMVALKAADAGTPPAATGIRVVSMQEIGIPSGKTSPQTIQFPSTGNLLVGAYVCGIDFTITGITDTKSNNWASSGSTVSNDSQAQMFYVASAISDPTLTLTVTFANSPETQDGTLRLYDIVGAAASPFDLRAIATGNQTVAGNITSTTITPTTANGLIIAEIGVATVNVNGITGTGQLFDSNESDRTLTNTENVSENNGWAHLYNTDTSSVTHTWTEFTAVAAGTWAALAVAFKAAVIGPSPILSTRFEFFS